MCGIAAIISAAPRRDLVERMAATLHHRGPDEQQLVECPGATMGHTRLSIIDLVGGKQPMADDSGRYWLIFNGEIFNYARLRHEMGKQGVQFRTTSDTEVLLKLCIAHGTAAPGMLNGQFAFLFWDSEMRHGFAARDRMGEKPLFYASVHGELFIASEIKALLATGLIEPRVSRQRLDAIFALDYLPGPRTIYEQIWQLPPGSILLIELEHPGVVKQYWKPAYEVRDDITESEAVGAIRKLIEEAVACQMVADVPVGAFLSGGLDSSTIVALASKHSQGPVKTFSVGFGGEINELPYARAVAEKYGTEHHELQVDLDVAEGLETMAEIFDQPIADSANLPTYLLSRFTRQKVKVALAGEGGDELFCGYWWHEHLGRLGWACDSWFQYLAFKIALKMGLVPEDRRTRTKEALVATAELARHPSIWERTLRMHVRAPEKWRERVAANGLRAVRESFPLGIDPRNINAVTEFDLRVYLADNILNKVDRASMAASLEVRSPLLDPHLVHFVLSLPWKLRYQPGEPKQLLKLACGDLLPPELLTRKKQGFGAPVKAWVERPDLAAIAARVCAPGSMLEALYPGIAEAYQTFEPQQKWRALSLGTWFEKHPVTLVE